MEFLRWGSQIPVSTWGCCAIDLIQGFDIDPDAPRALRQSYGDGGGVFGAYYGKTYREIFTSMLKTGTFNGDAMPNHGFLAVFSQSQLSGRAGSQWLAILKENGFEFIRAVDNSVYSDSGEDAENYECDCCGETNCEDCDGRGAEPVSAPVYVFGLFRNQGPAALADPRQPPDEWLALPLPTQTPEEIFHATEVKTYPPEELIAEGIVLYQPGQAGKLPMRVEDATKDQKAKPAPFNTKLTERTNP